MYYHKVVKSKAYEEGGGAYSSESSAVHRMASAGRKKGDMESLRLIWDRKVAGS